MLALLLVEAGLAAGGLDAHGFSAAGHRGDPHGFLELANPDPGWDGAWDAGVLRVEITIVTRVKPP